MQVANHLALWNRVQGCRAAGLQAANYLALRGAGVPVSGQCVSLGALGTGHPKPERLRCAAPRKRGAGRPLPWESGTAGNWDPPPPPPKTARPVPGSPVTPEVGRETAPPFHPPQQQLGRAGPHLPPSSRSSPGPLFRTKDAITSPHECPPPRGVQHPAVEQELPPGEGGETCLCSPAFPQRLFSSGGS